MSMENKHILVVEDDDDVRSLLERALLMGGYRVTLASHGREALTILESLSEEAQPHGILLDLMMPVMDGETFLAHWSEAKHPGRQNQKVIVATARGNALPESVTAHCVDVLAKPMDLETLYRVIETHVARG
jgi:CheY-like chemotaxis protein